VINYSENIYVLQQHTLYYERQNTEDCSDYIRLANDWVKCAVWAIFSITSPEI